MAAPTAVDTRILLISGSLRSGSVSTAALRTARELAPAGATAVLYESLARLPHFSPDLDAEPLPAAVAELRQELSQADALLLSTPEYAGSLPGSFLVEEACVQIPIERSAIGADGLLTDPPLRAAITAVLAALGAPRAGAVARPHGSPARARDNVSRAALSAPRAGERIARTAAAGRQLRVRAIASQALARPRTSARGRGSG